MATADPELLRAAAERLGSTPCDPPVPQIRYGTTPDSTVSQHLRALFEADQSARASEPIDWEQLQAADQQRRVAVSGYLQQGQLVTADDLYHVAMIFQHGNCSDHFKLASDLAERAVKQGHEAAKWLSAAALDRYLGSQGKPQKFGTQYFNLHGRWELYPVDPTTTDEERLRYNVEPLAAILARVEELNKA